MESGSKKTGKQLALFPDLVPAALNLDTPGIMELLAQDTWPGTLKNGEPAQYILDNIVRTGPDLSETLKTT